MLHIITVHNKHTRNVEKIYNKTHKIHAKKDVFFFRLFYSILLVFVTFFSQNKNKTKTLFSQRNHFFTNKSQINHSM
jgi:hypothetical protein